MIDSIGHGFAHGLSGAFEMLWDTLWALVVGFAISGAVQAFVSRDALRRRLGDHGPAAIVRASLYGAASSSCSYAASAITRSLIAGGADFVASLVFMFASTNLVIELGIVIAVLIGWQFVAAEFIGGALMILLLVLVGSLWFRGRALDRALSVVASTNPADRLDHADAESHIHDESGARQGWARARTRAGWSEAAGFAIGDLTMLRREMVIGFLAAGFAGRLVPERAWNALFLHGHGALTIIENVVIAPLVAVISCVCSIGNVPLAAALWRGGISFGGVVSFIFADLIALPLLLIYRKQYGAPMAARMFAVMWFVMSAAGLATEGLFHVLGWLPGTHPAAIPGEGIGFNVTTWLDVAALGILFALFWLDRHRVDAEDGRFAKDPMCGMLVEVAMSPASAHRDGETWFFCSDHCRAGFVAAEHH